jgi:hypothetical protein
MPMRRRASRSARRACAVRSGRQQRISPGVGSTSRLMQRISVDLPVPDGPMMAVIPWPSDGQVDVGSTGLPGT